MPDEQHSGEGAEEAIEDLAAPAEAQAGVAGGAGCIQPTRLCTSPTVVTICQGPTCKATTAGCLDDTHIVTIGVA